VRPTEQNGTAPKQDIHQPPAKDLVADLNSVATAWCGEAARKLTGAPVTSATLDNED